MWRNWIKPLIYPPFLLCSLLAGAVIFPWWLWVALLASGAIIGLAIKPNPHV
jgi:hypothetical protein